MLTPVLSRCGSGVWVAPRDRACARRDRTGGGAFALCRLTVVGWCDIVRLYPHLGYEHNGRLGIGVVEAWRGQGLSRVGSGLARPNPQRSFRGWIPAGGPRGLRFKHCCSEPLQKLRVHGGRGQASDAPPRRSSQRRGAHGFLNDRWISRASVARMISESLVQCM